MHIVCVGLSHQTAPVELRERVAIGEDAIGPIVAALHADYPNCELAILSTCNRTEVYCARPLHGHPRVAEIIEWLAGRSGVEADTIAESAYHHDNEEAVRHLMRVAAGLDSLAMGEAQVLGQVKRAYVAAQEAQSVGKVLHRVMRDAISAAKLSRTETGIGEGRTSISSIAVEFAGHLFHDFTDKNLLVLGAGKMTELTVRHFLELRPHRVAIANRTPQRAEQLAATFPEAPCTTHGLDRLDELLVDADIVISSTGATEPVVTAAAMRPILKRRRFRPLFVIDIAVPRDFDPAIGRLANVYLYDLDSLQNAIADTLASRNGAVSQGEAIVEKAALETYAAVQVQDVGDLIRLLRERFHELGDAETSRTLKKLRETDPGQMDDLLREHTHRLLNKLLHRPVSELASGRGARAAMYATAIRRLFEIEPDAEDLDDPERANERG